jgi:hypothetical protein
MGRKKKKKKKKKRKEKKKRESCGGKEMPEEYERNILIPKRRGRTGWVERREALF